MEALFPWRKFLGFEGDTRLAFFLLPLLPADEPSGPGSIHPSVRPHLQLQAALAPERLLSPRAGGGLEALPHSCGLLCTPFALGSRGPPRASCGGGGSACEQLVVRTLELQPLKFLPPFPDPEALRRPQLATGAVAGNMRVNLPWGAPLPGSSPPFPASLLTSKRE